MNTNRLITYDAVLRIATDEINSRHNSTQSYVILGSSIVVFESHDVLIASITTY